MSADIRGWCPAPSVAPYVTLDDRLNVLPLIDLSGVCRGRHMRRRDANRAASGRRKITSKAQTAPIGHVSADRLSRRTRERNEALERQAATAEVLKVISRATFDLQSVLDKLTETAARLCNADVAGITRERDGAYYYASVYNYPPELHDFIRAARHERTRGSVTGRVMLDRKTVHVRDVMRDPEYTMREFAQKAGFRTALGVPLLREGKAIGVIVLARSKILPFTDKQIDLVTTFADQAVIAIENARLFEAEQQRTRELRESLQQQTATADVLKLISRSAFDLPTVLNTLAESASRLCEADHVWLYRRDGEVYRWAASCGIPIKNTSGSSNPCPRYRSHRGVGHALDGPCWKVGRFKSPTCSPTRNTNFPTWQSSAGSGLCWASRCYVKACRSE